MLDKQALERITAKRNYGMSIITTAAGGKLAGCLIGFLTQCSIRPVHWMVCLSDKNHTFRVAVQASHLAIHFLSQSDLKLAELFGGKTGDNVDKFKLCKWSEGPMGMPILEGCDRFVVGKVIEKYYVGDHHGFLVDSEYASSPEGNWDMLCIDDCRDIKPGHPAY